MASVLIAGAQMTTVYIYARRHGMGLHTGIELDDVVRAGDFISQAIGRANSSRVGRALLTKWASQAGEATCA